MENSKIGWTTHTFNPWRGCTKVSEGCQNCYAERDSHRNPGVLGVWGKTGTREVAAEAQWLNPPKWNRAAEKAGRRDRVFCASLADIFEGHDTMPGDYGAHAVMGEPVVALEDLPAYVPLYNNVQVAQARCRLFDLIDETPHLDWLLLTKRPQNVLLIYGNHLHFKLHGKWPRNLWIGASIENQKRADERAPHLTLIRSAGCPVCFASCEPLLGPVDLRPWLDRETGINWVIVGGESGAVEKVRAFDPHWGRMLRDQCDEHDVPCFVKQLGVIPLGLGKITGKGEDIDEFPEYLRVRDFPTVA